MPAEIDLAGKRVLVTGGASGIGAALASGFADAGAAVAIHYHSNRDLASVLLDGLAARGVAACAVEADLTVPGEAARVVEEVRRQLGEIDVLVNNAGTLVARAELAGIDDTHFHAVVDVNLYSTVACCRAAVPAMKERRSGVIINVSSIAARHGGGPGASLYAAAKAAVSTFTRGLARELAPHGVRVNALSPGVIDTDFHQRYSTPASLEAIIATIPMRRLGSAEEMVGPVLFLASDAKSGYVTGQVLEVNGGMYSP